MFKSIFGKKKDDWKKNLDTLENSNNRSSQRLTPTPSSSSENISTTGFDIYYAARKGSVSELQLLLLASASEIDCTDGMGDTALHYAAKSGYNDIVSVLLENRANPNIQNNSGMTPLHEAARAGHVSIIRKLVEAGASAQLKRSDGLLAAELAESAEVREVFRKYDAHKQSQVDSSSQKDLPFQYSTILNMLSSPFLVSLNCINFAACCMVSDKCITVCESSLGKVAIIDIASGGTSGSSGGNITRHLLAAESAMMNPASNLLAWKDKEFLHLFDIKLATQTRQFKLPFKVSFWRWVNPTTIAFLTDKALFHWNAEGPAAPVKVFDIAPELLAALQIINYQVSPDGRSCLLAAIANGTTPGTFDGIMQLYSVDTSESEILHGHCGIFSVLSIPERSAPFNILVYEDKTSEEFTNLRIREVGRAANAPGNAHMVTSLPMSSTAPDAPVNDFPVTMNASREHGLVYMITRSGFLTVFDIFTGKTLHRTRVTKDAVFCSVNHTSSGGILAITRKGGVLQVNVNRNTILAHVVKTVGEPQLAVDLAARLRLSGAEELCAAHFSKQNAKGDVVKFAIRGMQNSDRGLVLDTVPEECKPVIVTIDFGNTHSGVAFSYKVDPQAIQCSAPTARDLVERKVPTSLLLQEDGTWLFGNEAEAKYYEILMNQESTGPTTPLNAHLFRSFKHVLKGKFSGFDTINAISAAGKPHPLMDLVVRTLTHLKEFIVEKTANGYGLELQPSSDVQWVITVPTSWNDFAKAFVRKAAFAAGLMDYDMSDSLIITLEPECAALAFHVSDPQNNLLALGNKFMVLDCGGCSVDISVHEVKCLSPLSIPALGTPTGGDWGGDFVNLEFKKFLKELLGAALYTQQEKAYPYDFHRVYFTFDQIKVKCDPALHPAGIELGDVLENKRQLVGLAEVYNAKHPVAPVLLTPQLRTGVLTLSNALMLSFFDPLLALIEQEVKRGLAEHPTIKHIVVAGGFGASRVLTERLSALESGKSKLKVICSGSRCTPQTAVAQGGILYGVYKTTL